VRPSWAWFVASRFDLVGEFEDHGNAVHVDCDDQVYVPGYGVQAAGLAWLRLDTGEF
jgi:hypothetical protein